MSSIINFNQKNIYNMDGEIQGGMAREATPHIREANWDTYSVDIPWVGKLVREHLNRENHRGFAAIRVEPDGVVVDGLGKAIDPIFGKKRFFVKEGSEKIGGPTDTDGYDPEKGEIFEVKLTDKLSPTGEPEGDVVRLVFLSQEQAYAEKSHIRDQEEEKQQNQSVREKLHAKNIQIGQQAGIDDDFIKRFSEQRLSGDEIKMFGNVLRIRLDTAIDASELANAASFEEQAELIEKGYRSVREKIEADLLTSTVTLPFIEFFGINPDKLPKNVSDRHAYSDNISALKGYWKSALDAQFQERLQAIENSEKGMIAERIQHETQGVYSNLERAVMAHGEKRKFLGIISRGRETVGLNTEQLEQLVTEWISNDINEFVRVFGSDSPVTSDRFNQLSTYILSLIRFHPEEWGKSIGTPAEIADACTTIFRFAKQTKEERGAGSRVKFAVFNIQNPKDVLTSLSEGSIKTLVAYADSKSLSQVVTALNTVLPITYYNSFPQSLRSQKLEAPETVANTDDALASIIAVDKFEKGAKARDTSQFKNKTDGPTKPQTQAERTQILDQRARMFRALFGNLLEQLRAAGITKKDRPEETARSIASLLDTVAAHISLNQQQVTEEGKVDLLLATLLERNGIKRKEEVNAALKAKYEVTYKLLTTKSARRPATETRQFLPQRNRVDRNRLRQLFGTFGNGHNKLSDEEDEDQDQDDEEIIPDNVIQDWLKMVQDTKRG